MAVLLLRLPWTAWRAAHKQRLSIHDTAVLHLRVRITDLDWYGHMNNGRFLTSMDLGRTDLATRIGLLGVFRSHRIQPVVAGATIRFRRSLTAFRRYELHTRIVGWDDRWTFFEQRFVRHDGTLAALAYAKVALRTRDGAVAPARALALVGWAGPAPALPDEIGRWQSVDAS